VAEKAGAKFLNFLVIRHGALARSPRRMKKRFAQRRFYYWDWRCARDGTY
jgi:hypothetical protein